MVQLKLKEKRAAGKINEGFNSCMVQLKLKDLSPRGSLIECFNSCMVQLKSAWRLLGMLARPLF